MSSIRVATPPSVLPFRALLAGVLMTAAPALGVAQSADARVGMSLRVLAPVPTVTPGMSMSVTREGIATIQPRTAPSGPMSTTVTTFSATDDRGPLLARFAVPARARNGQQNEVAVHAPALVGFGLLSPDTTATAGPAKAYLVRLRDTAGYSAADTGVVHIRLRQVIALAGS